MRPTLYTFAPLLLAASIVGCSGDDTTNPEDSGVDQSTQDASVDSGKDAGKDSTVIDAQPDVAKDTGSDATDGATDATTDGATDGGDAGDAGDGGLPPVGSPCNTANEIQQQDCGLCGFQKRACLPGDGGLVWSDWGFCQNQVVNGCDPKLSYPDTACGNCGTKKTVCLNNCNYDVTQTCNEPPNACKPQSTEFVLGLSCDAGGRERTCDNQCKFGNFGNCQDGPTLPLLTISGTVGQTVNHVVTMPASPKLARITTSTSIVCPVTSGTSTLVSYVYTRVYNSDPTKTAVVAVYHSTPLNGTYIDSTMAVYSGSIPPADNDLTARKACLTGTNIVDGCFPSFTSPALNPAPVPTACSSSSAGIRNITIPPLGSIVVYSTAFFGSDSGDIQVNAYTQSLN